MAAAGLSTETVALRCAHMRQLARALDGAHPQTVDGEQIIEWLSGMSWSRETRRAHRSSIRQFFAFLGRPEVATMIPRVKPSEPMPMPIPESKLRVALAAADDRTRLILRLAAEAGLRRGEIARIHADDLHEDLDGPALLVHGKGDKLRIVPLSEGLSAALRLRSGGGWVFPGSWGPGHLSPRRVGELAIAALPAPWTLHKLRHRFGTVVHDGCRDLIVVQQLLGHASLATTQRYVATSRVQLRAAAAIAAA